MTVFCMSVKCGYVLEELTSATVAHKSGVAETKVSDKIELKLSTNVSRGQLVRNKVPLQLSWGGPFTFGSRKNVLQ